MFKNLGLEKGQELFGTANRLLGDSIKQKDIRVFVEKEYPNFIQVKNLMRSGETFMSAINKSDLVCGYDQINGINQYDVLDYV